MNVNLASGSTGVGFRSSVIHCIFMAHSAPAREK
jgi:hypothetical protein